MKTTKLFLYLYLLAGSIQLTAQVSINTGSIPPHYSSMLDVSSTNRGILIPRMTLTQRDAITLPAEGLIVYQTDGIPGLYSNIGTSVSPAWRLIGYNAGPFSQWTTSGSDIYYSTGSVGIGSPSPVGMLHIKGRFDIPQLVVDANNLQSITNPLILLRDTLGFELMRIHTDSPGNVFIGLDAGRVNSYVNGVQGRNNTFIGSSAGYANTSGDWNTGIGSYALWGNSSGSGNTASGIYSMNSNTTGNNNTAVGWGTLYNNKAGNNATAVGLNAMYYTNDNSSPFINYNVAVGYEALRGSYTPSANTGNNNTALGYQAMLSNSSGYENTAIGTLALLSNTTGTSNTANGSSTLYNNISGHGNSAFGRIALYYNETGSNNTAAGNSSMYYNISGEYNTAFGVSSLYSNLAGSNATAIGAFAMLYANNSIFPFVNINVALGYEALMGSTDASQNTGNSNTALGYQALRVNTTGSYNTASGMGSMYANSTGSNNTANGTNALASNYSGNLNTAVGVYSLYTNSTGTNNTGLGYRAGYLQNSANLTAVGYQAGDGNAHGNWCTFIGSNTDANAAGYYNSMAMGDAATITASNQVRIGDAGVTDIGGYASWTNLSDMRFKKNIQEDIKGLDFIMKLRPISYTMDLTGLNDFLGVPDDKNASVTHKESIRYSGFAAQEVEVAANEAGYDFSGVHKPESEKDYYGLSYAEFVVPLVKAVQEQQAIIDQQQIIIEELFKKNLELERKVEALNIKEK